MRRTMLLSILALTIGCEPQIDQSAQAIAVYHQPLRQATCLLIDPPKP